MAEQFGSAEAARKNWLLRYIRLQAKYDVQIDRLLREAAEDAARVASRISDKPGIGAEVRRTQLTATGSSLLQTLSGFWQALGSLIRAGSIDAARSALDASFNWDEVLLRRTHPDKSERDAMRRSLLATADRGVEVMLLRVFSDHIPLSTQIYKTEAIAQGWIERLINSAIARNASAAELAKDIREFVRPDAPGGASYAAKRLARTEINNAFHAKTIDTNRDKPWVTDMAWKTSKSHPKPDICDELQRQGPYAKDNVPAKPHPQCLCYTYPVTVSVAEFEKQFLAGAYDNWLNMHYRTDDRPALPDVA